MQVYLKLNHHGWQRDQQHHHRPYKTNPQKGIEKYHFSGFRFSVFLGRFKRRKSTCSRRTNTCVHDPTTCIMDANDFFLHLRFRYFHLIFIRHKCLRYFSLFFLPFRLCQFQQQTLFLVPEKRFFLKHFEEIVRMDDGGEGERERKEKNKKRSKNGGKSISWNRWALEGENQCERN